jgi:hypothetical protein
VTMRICCIDGASQYDALTSFLDGVAAGFEACGQDVIRMGAVEAIETSAERAPRCDLVFSFAGIGMELRWDVPFLTWLVDNPVSMPMITELQVGRDGVLVVAGEHEQVVRTFLNFDLAAGFLPHGVTINEAAGTPRFDDDARPIDVLLCGSAEFRPQPRVEASTEALGKTLEQLTDLAEQRLYGHVRRLEPSRLFRDAAATDLPYQTTLHRNIAPLLAWLDEHLRTKRRIACVRALDAAGVTVHLVGNGWDRVEDLVHAQKLGPVAFSNVDALARTAKVLLNVGPLFNLGWHERIPLGMATGASVLTEANDFIAGTPDVDALVTQFEMRERDALPDLVMQTLKDPQRPEHAAAAYDYVRATHTWAHRAETILQMVET